jgi:16S rRNA (guanine527-N7)-methyltransferase
VTGKKDPRGGGGGKAASLNLQGFERAAGVSHETALRFEIWRALLEKWSTRINLVSRSTLGDFWSRHALDSAQVVAAADSFRRGFAPETEQSGRPLRWVDLGSGAGFPGLAVALVLEGAGRADEVHLVESDQRKAAFLREAIRATGSRAEVHGCRIETIPADVVGEGFDVVTARACAPLPELLGYAVSLWKEQTVGVFLKGRDAEAELTLSAKSWRFQFDLQPSRSDPEGRVVLIKRLEHVQSS